LPYKPKHPCAHPGCPELVPYGEKYCEKHKGMHPEEARSAASRGYGSRWNKARKMYLAAHPLCEQCLKEGRYTKATVVDHIRPHRGNPELFWNPDNWQALCKKCHDKKTGEFDSRPEYKY
jgi:5-methylcytosine-specific restriction protein A